MMKYTLIVVLATLLIGCNQGLNELKPVQPNEQNNNDETPVSGTMNGDEVIVPGIDNSVAHEVVVLEVLPTTNYIYLRVKENELEYWIAAIKMEVEIGETYFYTGGMPQENFVSKEHNRTFEKLILVNELVSTSHNRGQQQTKVEIPTNKEKGEVEIRENGTIPIADLVNNSDAFIGKIVKIEGKCVKINTGIMGTNWLHLDDGTNQGYDLVATSDHVAEVGVNVVLRGILVANKDFGAGYSYALLLENCDLIQ